MEEGQVEGEAADAPERVLIACSQVFFLQLLHPLFSCGSSLARSTLQGQDRAMRRIDFNPSTPCSPSHPAKNLEPPEVGAFQVAAMLAAAATWKFTGYPPASSRHAFQYHVLAGRPPLSESFPSHPRWSASAVLPGQPSGSSLSSRSETLPLCPKSSRSSRATRSGGSTATGTARSGAGRSAGGGASRARGVRAASGRVPRPPQPSSVFLELDVTYLVSP